MKRHKKNDDDHDYCHKCDEDFESYEDLAQHKVIRPDMHDKACRICGQEFKSDSGLKRHIELVDSHITISEKTTDKTTESQDRSATQLHRLSKVVLQGVSVY